MYILWILIDIIAYIYISIITVSCRVVSLQFKIFSSLLNHFSLPPKPWQLLIFYCLHSFVFSKMKHSRKYTICGFFRLLLLLSFMDLSFLYVFTRIDNSFLFSTELYSTISGCTTIYLSIHRLESILVASKIWQS